MLGIDTNVLVRYLVGDDRSQYERARRLIHRAALGCRATATFDRKALKLAGFMEA
jgi:predicted nucleic-acid-binding protein